MVVACKHERTRYISPFFVALGLAFAKGTIECSEQNKNISIYCVVPLVVVQGNVWDTVCTCSTFLCAGGGSSGDGECMHGVIINN